MGKQREGEGRSGTYRRKQRQAATSSLGSVLKVFCHQPGLGTRIRHKRLPRNGNGTQNCSILNAPQNNLVVGVPVHKNQKRGCRGKFSTAHQCKIKTPPALFSCTCVHSRRGVLFCSFLLMPGLPVFHACLQMLLREMQCVLHPPSPCLTSTVSSI